MSEFLIKNTNRMLQAFSVLCKKFKKNCKNFFKIVKANHAFFFTDTKYFLCTYQKLFFANSGNSVNS